MKEDAWREVVHHPGATAIVAVTEDNKIVMERQFRYALQQTLLEVPAGKLDPNEEPIVCAKRELAEETGYRAGMTAYSLSAGTSTQRPLNLRI